jgi:hypothetical protein
MDTKQRSLLDSGMALAAVTAFLYCASTAFTGGYLGPLGLDGDVLDRNFQQILYHGFLISFGPALLALIVYVLCRFFYSHAILPGINDKLRKSWKRKRQFLRLKHHWTGKRKDSAIELREKQHSKTFAVLAAVFFVLILSLVYFESKGREAATLVRTKLESKSFLEHEMITVVINGQAQKLLYLTCGARNCAGVDPGTRIVQYFPQNGHSYVLPALPQAKMKEPASQKTPSK